MGTGLIGELWGLPCKAPLGSLRTEEVSGMTATPVSMRVESAWGQEPALVRARLGVALSLA